MANASAPAWRGLLVAIATLLATFCRAPAAAADNTLAAVHPRPSPALVLDRVGGGRLAAADRRGSVLLVHFFATWCEPCRPELASLDRLWRETAPRGLDILAASVAEPEARLVRFFAERPVAFPVVLDRDRAASRSFDVDALPSTLVLDRAGQVRLAVRGDLDWARADVRDALDALLAEPGPIAPSGGNETK